MANIFAPKEAGKPIVPPEHNGRQAWADHMSIVNIRWLTKYKPIDGTFRLDTR